ncbi:hypothetical protein PoB_004501200 [Plakobranchus ocellatus]|uniref:CCHC-type domain-containing protein n=1 Tax=Plakobranchus ocellatus TaxID=259542 RepID=A0AAV4BGW7_9GAST|nr:hypothetical protein PoB_004501200 [Plakobranchus ocellatus]
MLRVQSHWKRLLHTSPDYSEEKSPPSREFRGRIKNKVCAMSLRVDEMEGRIDKLERSRRLPSLWNRSTSPLACYGCGNSGEFISQCPERGNQSHPKNGRGCKTSRERQRPRSPHDNRCRTCGEQGVTVTEARKTRGLICVRNKTAIVQEVMARGFAHEVRDRREQHSPRSPHAKRAPTAIDVPRVGIGTTASRAIKKPPRREVL